jgi:hypothetical protein
MFTAFRVVGSILAGLVLALMLISVVEFLSAIVHPTPPDFNGTMEEMCEHVARFPQWVLALVVPAWAGTAFASTWVTRRFGNRGAGAFVGLLLIAAVGFNVTKLPYPMWFKGANLIAIPIAILIALRSPSRLGPTEVKANT